MSNATESAGPTDITARTLRDWPLPQPSFDGDKEVRGHVLIVGGAREMPGAVMLAATAALRAGAGKLTIATAASVAPLVAMAIPEARVIGLAETANGGFTIEAARKLGELAGKVGAMLVGPGMQDEGATAELVHALLPRFVGTALVLDAAAMSAVRMAGEPHLLDEAKDMAHFRFAEPVLLTPHAGELSHLTGEDKDALAADPVASALERRRGLEGSNDGHRRTGRATLAARGRQYRPGHFRLRRCAGGHYRRPGRAWRHPAAGSGLGRGTARVGGRAAVDQVRRAGLPGARDLGRSAGPAAYPGPKLTPEALGTGSDLGATRPRDRCLSPTFSPTPEKKSAGCAGANG